MGITYTIDFVHSEFKKDKSEDNTIAVVAEWSTVCLWGQ